MDALYLLTAAALTQGNKLSELPRSDQSMAQITPVYQLERQPISESSIEPDEPDAAAQPFSPTVFLEGEAILGVSASFSSALDDPLVFQRSIELIFNASFTGEDLLAVGFESGNGSPFAYVDELTFEGRLGFAAETEDHRFEISELSYEAPIGERASFYIATTGDDLDDFSLFPGDNNGASGNGAVSEFGTENPIHNLVEDTGLQFNYDLTDQLSLSLGYFAGDTGNPDSEAGLFNGNHSAFVQFGFEPSDQLLLGATYIHTYSDSSLATETGSLRSQIDLERPVIGNSYEIAAAFFPSPRFAVGGWVGVTNATVLDLGNAEVWNYALTLAFADLGRAGSVLGVVIGQEPRLTGTSGFKIDQRRHDPDISLHLEAFYDYALSDHISVTPGLIWITAPNHDASNPSIFVLTIRIRTTFKF